ncbi:aminopeptidase N-like [Chironomus tepperi]|uniref:aminopeptidase N-like n=1 Tax=Chironomus tepperi TaxID=113505 RepID=UPI00391F28A3
MGKFYVISVLIAAFILSVSGNIRRIRSIDLSATHSLVSETKLPGEVVPNNYTLDLRPNVDEATFTGSVVIVVTFQEPTNKVVLHASHSLDIAENEIKLVETGIDSKLDPERKFVKEKDLDIRRVDKIMKKSILEIYLKDTVKQGTIARLEISFNGKIYENSEGIFKGSYIDGMDKK